MIGVDVVMGFAIGGCMLLSRVVIGRDVIFWLVLRGDVLLWLVIGRSVLVVLVIGQTVAQSLVIGIDVHLWFGSITLTRLMVGR